MQAALTWPISFTAVSSSTEAPASSCILEKFFKIALPSEVEKLGIVYTPQECVDFIIHSVEYLMNKDFGKSLSDHGVHIIDGFTGTGTFIVRLFYEIK